MAYPTTPSLSLARLTSTSFRASVAGGDPALTQRVYYREVGGGVDAPAGSVPGAAGSVDVTGLAESGQYQAYAVGDDAAGQRYSLPFLAWVSLAAPDSLAEAFHARWYAQPALVSLVTGGLWTGEVPEGTEPPYAWLDVAGVDPLPLMADEQLEPSRAVVHVYAEGAAAAEACARRVRTAFDYQTLPFAAAASVSLRPLHYRLVCEGVRYKQGQLVYRAALTYHALVQRSR